MERIVIDGIEARDKVIAGAKKVTGPVGSSLGPFGLNALIEKGTRVTNDGMKIAQEISLEDEIEDLGARKIREAMAKSNEQAGDGSTTIAVLAEAILVASSKLLPKEGVVGKLSTADFIRKVKTERDEVIGKLKEIATPIETEEQLVNSAVVSVEDRDMGELIGKTQWELGKDGFILTEEAPDKDSSVEHIRGVRIDNGFGASFVMNDQEKQMLIESDVHTILTNHTIQDLKPLEGVLNQFLKTGKKKIAIIARAFTNEAIADCGRNIQNGFNIYPINGPYTDMNEVMKDLAAVLGGQFIDAETHDLADTQYSDLGFAEKIRARRYDAIITGKNSSDSERVQKRLADLKDQLKGSQSDFEKRNLEARIAQLEHGFALIKVGAESDTERKRLFDKVEDACNAVRAALQEGTVPGAGLAFKQIADELPEDYILKRPLQALHEQVMANAPADFIVEDWVRDPVKVLRIALEQAVSVAADLSTINVAIATKKQRYNAFVKGNEPS